MAQWLECTIYEQKGCGFKSHMGHWWKSIRLQLLLCHIRKKFVEPLRKNLAFLQGIMATNNT